jgi:hypothetical protein
MSAVLIAAWAKNDREEIRVHLDRFKDRDIIDVRTWWRDRDDELKPGRSGITLATRHLPSLSNALAKALQEAERRGLLKQEAT